MVDQAKAAVALRKSYQSLEDNNQFCNCLQTVQRTLAILKLATARENAAAIYQRVSPV